MAFVYSSLKDVGQPKIDIIFIPAIGADPKDTFAREPDRPDHQRLDLDIQDRLNHAAHVHLYDHLTAAERGIQFPRRQSFVDFKEHVDNTNYVVDERAVAQYSVRDWAERLLMTLMKHREERGAVDRPIIFICHSTGGNVLKQALIEKKSGNLNDIANNTIAITFFAVPHHGSTALSRGRYVQEIQAHLRLKWPMSDRLRDDFLLRDQNEGLQSLNHRFALDLAGVRIHSYSETADSHLTILRSTKRGAEDLETVFRECIVDGRSGKLSTPQVPVEDEDFMQLDLTHTELPRFTGQDEQYNIYIRAIETLVTGYNDVDRAAYRKLQDAIMRDVKVHVHQFYVDEEQMKILLAKPTLSAFLQFGPDKAMNERLEGRDTDMQNTTNADRPQLTLHPASEPKAVPSFKVETFESDKSSDDNTSGRLTPPHESLPQSIHTRRPPEPPIPSDAPTTVEEQPTTGKLGVGPPPQTHPKAVRFDKDQIIPPVNSPTRPVQSAALHLPEQSAGFRWIHVPFTHPGWVHQILCTVSEEKRDRKLHNHILLDKIWISQHNQARHASPHARFVRPSVKFLFPQGTEKTEGLSTIPSSCEDIQSVVYLPYLHWDSYKQMNKRAAIVERRLQQMRATPIPNEISSGKSIEQKRTLDQYGYPALKNTKVRDDDQILWKRTGEEARIPALGAARGGKRPGKQTQPDIIDPDSPIPKVLMVDQLWLWIIDHETVVTFFPGRENDNEDGVSREGDVRSLIYQDINGDFANRCNDPYDFAALAIRHTCRALLAKTTDRNLQVFRIFEEYISILTERQNRSWKEFRHSQERGLKSIDKDKHLNNGEDLNSLLELRDIEDELKTIDKLLQEQAKVISDMLAQYTESLNLENKGLKGTEFLTDISSFLAEQQTQVASMRESTSVAQSAYKDLLDMKQKQANVLEARLASEQSQVAVRQSRAVLIFTIFTIIFLPLSFFASVFGINSAEWNEEGTHFLPLREIFTYMLTLSFGCIVIALLAAFSRSARRHARRMWHRIGPKLRVNDRVGSGSSRNAEVQSWQWDKGTDLERQAAAVQQKRDEVRLSLLSRSQTIGYQDEKFEKDMQRRGGSVTGWWAGRKTLHDDHDPFLHKAFRGGLNGHAS